MLPQAEKPRTQKTAQKRYSSRVGAKVDRHPKIGCTETKANPVPTCDASDAQLFAPTCRSLTRNLSLHWAVRLQNPAEHAFERASQSSPLGRSSKSADADPLFAESVRADSQEN